LGEVARDVVVGLAWFKVGADARLKRLDPWRARDACAHDMARGGQALEGRERIADHGGDSHRADGVIEGPEGFGTVGIEFGEVVQVGVGQVGERDPGAIERAQEGEGVEAGNFQLRPEVRRNLGGRRTVAHAARMTRSPSARKGDLGPLRGRYAASDRGIRSWAVVAHCPLSQRSRRARSRRAPRADQRMPAWRKRACTICLWALSTAPLPMP
jgi:hypothetical protein